MLCARQLDISQCVAEVPATGEFEVSWSLSAIKLELFITSAVRTHILHNLQ
jgi:hypothetical protein